MASKSNRLISVNAPSVLGVDVDLPGFDSNGTQITTAADLLAGLRQVQSNAVGTVTIAGSSLADANLKLGLLGTGAKVAADATVGGITGNSQDNLVNVAAGAEVGSINLGSGNDTLTSAAGSTITGIIDGGLGSDNLTTGDGDTELDGGGGNDKLTATGDGDNVFNGGSGADTMAAGEGDDTYFVDNSGDKVMENKGEGYDQVYSSIDYTLTANVEKLILTGNGALDGNGNSMDNAIAGNSGDNTLNGMAGNDALDGKHGADRMIGGTGDDTYYVDETGDAVVENTGEGNDRIFSSITRTLAANVETLTLTGTTDIDGTGTNDKDTLIGNSGDNTLTGLDGNDRLEGGGGVDRLVGGAGDDTYYVEDSRDVVVEATNAGHDLVHSTETYTISADVEDLTLDGAFAVNGTGNSMSNTIRGNAGDNHLYGMAGNDTIDGGSGNDTMEGGIGDDTYAVSQGDDNVIEKSGEGYDTVSASVSYTMDGNVERLNLYGVGAINGTGNSGANNIVGNRANNVIDGMAGDDTLRGELGNDDLDGSNGNDSLNGGDGNDVLDGGAGRDFLEGGAGADRFVFDPGEFGGATTKTADVILDFSRGQKDKIDLHSVDADQLEDGNQAFSFIGTKAFHHEAGELRVEKISGNTFLFADNDGDGAADWSIQLMGKHTDITASDFVL